jgi:hypothetical protein
VQGPSRLLPAWGVLLTLALAAAFSAAPASAKLPRTYQVTRVDSPTPESNQRFGETMVNAGTDVDGDGPDDLIVGTGRAGQVRGQVVIVSGASGSVIREIPGPSDDVNGNGTEIESTQADPDAPSGFGAAVASIGDIGSCTSSATFEPGGAPGDYCDLSIVPQTDQDTGDGVPEILVSAPGLDVATESDDRGAVFVIDGATGAILKRLEAPDATTDVGFGRALLSPAGETACGGVGLGGISPCVYGNSPAVRQGDLNDGGKSDIVIGAPDFNETAATNSACSDGAGGGTCSRSGRVYVFYGEDLRSLPPTQPPATAGLTIKNPFPQDDNPALDQRFWPESMGLSLAPLGDIGGCRTPGTPGTECPGGQRTDIADGNPDYVVSVPQADVGTIPDVGLAFAVDGASGAILDTYRHPEPQPEALFGFSSQTMPAIGDVGGFNVVPDVYLPAIGQTGQFAGQGKAYVFTGSGTGSHLISTLLDPTPQGQRWASIAFGRKC